MAPQVQLIHEEGQVVEAELCVVAHEQAAALLDGPIRHILSALHHRRQQGPAQHEGFARSIPLDRP